MCADQAGSGFILLVHWYDWYDWYEWKIIHSIGIPLVNCISLWGLKVTMHLQIDNFLQIWIFESKYWSKGDL